MSLELPSSYFYKMVMQNELKVPETRDRLTRAFYWQLFISVSYVAFARKLVENWLFLCLPSTFGVLDLQILRSSLSNDARLMFMFRILRRSIALLPKKIPFKLVLSTHEDSSCQKEAVEIFVFKVTYVNEPDEDSLSEDVVAGEIEDFLQNLRDQLDKLRYGEAPYREEVLSSVPGVLATLIGEIDGERKFNLFLPPGIERPEEACLPFIEDAHVLYLGRVQVGPFIISVKVRFRTNPLLIGPLPQIKTREQIWEEILTLPDRVVPRTNEEFFATEEFKRIREQARLVTSMEIDCPCNQDNKDGVFRCYCCGYWQHFACFGLCGRRYVSYDHVCLQCARKYQLTCTDPLLTSREGDALQDGCRYRKALIRIIEYMYEPDDFLPMPHLAFKVQDLKDCLNCGDPAVPDAIVARLLVDQVIRPSEGDSKRFVNVNKTKLDEAFYKEVGQRIPHHELNMENEYLYYDL